MFALREGNRVDGALVRDELLSEGHLLEIPHGADLVEARCNQHIGTRRTPVEGSDRAALIAALVVLHVPKQLHVRPLHLPNLNFFAGCC